MLSDINKLNWTKLKTSGQRGKINTQARQKIIKGQTTTLLKIKGRVIIKTD